MSKSSKVSKSFNVFNGITISEKLFKCMFEEYSMSDFINSELFTKDSNGKLLPKMSVDSFIHFSISERLHNDKKFFRTHPEFTFDKLNDRIRTQINEYIKEHNTSDLLFTENHVKYFRNCYAFLLGKYGNQHMNKKIEQYDGLIEDFIFDYDSLTIEDLITTLVEDHDVNKQNAFRTDIFTVFTVVVMWVNGRWNEYLEEKAAKEAKEAEEAKARREQHIENCINIQRFGAEYQKPLTYDAKPVKRNQHRRMNQRGRPVVEKK